MRPLPRRLPRVVIAALVATALGLGILEAWRFTPFSAAPSLPPPALRRLALQAKVVAGATDVLRTRRRGRVLAIHAAPGSTVDSGALLVEFEDLALLESRASLQRKIAALQADPVAALDTQRAASAKARQDIRLAALQDLRDSYKTAHEDFARWKTLHEEGLVARLEYEHRERELVALRDRLEATRASTEAPTLREASEQKPIPTELQRSQRLLERLARLPDSFGVKSPWQAWVEEIHVQPGEIPPRGAPLVTVARIAPPRLEACVERQKEIMAVRSACGLPGPFVFTLRDGILSLPAPSPKMLPGEACGLELLLRP